MKIKVLVENTKENSKLKAVHGLCLYIEMDKYKILFDLGPSSVLRKNSDILGVNLNAVDSVVLSHGHIDHCGGIKTFRNINSKADIYLHATSNSMFRYKLNSLISIPVYNKYLLKNESVLKPITQVSGSYQLNPYSTILCNFNKKSKKPVTNKGLEIKFDKWEEDSFDHEMALLLNYKDKTVLFTGCSHNGLKNIVVSVKEETGLNHIDYVIGGFHIIDPINKKFVKDEYFSELVKFINNEKKTMFYTGHCTGSVALTYLKELCPGKVKKLSTGKIINI